MKKYKTIILISIIVVAILGLSYLNYSISCSSHSRLKEKIQSNQIEIDTLEFQNGAMRFSLEVKDKEIKDLKEYKATSILVLKYAKEEIGKLAEYMEFMQSLCEANGLTYPYYVVGE